jgi:hypothetical protein
MPNSQSGLKMLGGWYPKEFYNKVHNYKDEINKDRVIALKVKDLIYEALSSYMTANPLGK